MMVTFYCLLQVGEYTKPRFAQQDRKPVPATRTKQFATCNVGFFKEGKLIEKMTPLEVLLTSDLATLKITNKK